MAEKKKAKESSQSKPFDCPLGHEKSMKYISIEDREKQPITIRRIVRRLGPQTKIAICSKCGLILTFADTD